MKYFHPCPSRVLQIKLYKGCWVSINTAYLRSTLFSIFLNQNPVARAADVHFLKQVPFQKWFSWVLRVLRALFTKILGLPRGCSTTIQRSVEEPRPKINEIVIFSFMQVRHNRWFQHSRFLAPSSRFQTIFSIFHILRGILLNPYWRFYCFDRSNTKLWQ